MRTPALFWVGLSVFVLNDCGGRVPRVWSDVSARIARGDAEAYLQVRIHSDGRMAARATRDGRTWREWGAWPSVEEDPRALYSVLGGLRSAMFRTAVSAKTPSEPGASSPSRVWILMDVDANSRWSWAASVADAATHRRIGIPHLTFLDPDARDWIDLDLGRLDDHVGLQVKIDATSATPPAVHVRHGVTGPWTPLDEFVRSAEPPPSGPADLGTLGDVTYADVLTVLRALHERGVTEIRILSK